MVSKKSAADLLSKESDLKHAAEIAFKKMDLDKSGWLSKDEVATAMRSFMMEKGHEPEQTDIDLAFEKLDKNHDGKISFKEFLSMSKDVLRRAK